jgi:choline kinase
MVKVDLSRQELTFLLALLESDKQTALQLLAADHFYEPKLLPKLRKAERDAKEQQRLLKELKEREAELLG